jgi:tetratricopeptide (TPR) repeat protein
MPGSVGQLARWPAVIAFTLAIFHLQPCAAETDAEMAQRYLRAAERNDVTSQAYVGALYSAGVGFEQSDREAFRWLLQAAEHGHAQAQVIVAELYALGKGTPKSNKDAYRWAAQAAKTGDSTIRSSAQQLMDVLASRMSATEQAEAKKSVATTQRVATPPVKVGDARSYYRRGRARALNGEYALAIEDFRKVNQLLPNNADALNDLCWTQAVSGDVQNALKNCNESLRIRPHFADALDSRGLAYLKLGNLDEAVADFNEVLKLKPDHASALYGRGIVKLRQGKTKDGTKDLQSARGLDPDIAAKFLRYGIE